MQDAQNSLIEIATRIDLGGYFGGPDEGDQRLRFGYDYMGRRSEKTHEVHTSGNWVMQSGYPKWFIYDGWNVQLVLRPGSTYDPVTNPTDIVTERKYTWGLDLSGSFHGAGGIGGLLAAVETQGTSQTGDDVSYWYVYDANGNVGQLINGTTPSTPVLAAHYEYDPYGNLLAAVDVDSSVKRSTTGGGPKCRSCAVSYFFRPHFGSHGSGAAEPMPAPNGADIDVRVFG